MSDYALDDSVSMDGSYSLCIEIITALDGVVATRTWADETRTTIVVTGTIIVVTTLDAFEDFKASVFFEACFLDFTKEVAFTVVAILSGFDDSEIASIVATDFVHPDFLIFVAVVTKRDGINFTSTIDFGIFIDLVATGTGGASSDLD
ncbi:hypothetical protein PanWU01x14_335180 [Parasponia andersonii]|uniref:Uncharacterized protein n=1 Tax=Parasponia andersonii TaxID=3476 RepID=A0A2P5AGA4_PARAD|nr:hypothetical protein PanWU01x14_335180 [Parasponia andersonii]